jgi:hypothetical protein
MFSSKRSPLGNFTTETGTARRRLMPHRQRQLELPSGFRLSNPFRHSEAKFYPNGYQGVCIVQWNTNIAVVKQLEKANKWCSYTSP